MIKMLDFEYSNQWDLKPNPDLDLQTLTHMYEESIDQILPSFYATLWNNNLEAKKESLQLKSNEQSTVQMAKTKKNKTRKR